MHQLPFRGYTDRSSPFPSCRAPSVALFSHKKANLRNNNKVKQRNGARYRFFTVVLALCPLCVSSSLQSPCVSDGFLLFPPMAFPHGPSGSRGRRSNPRNWRHPSLPPIMPATSSQQWDRHVTRSSFSATPPPREDESVNLSSIHFPFSPRPHSLDQRRVLPSVQELHLGSTVSSPSLTYLPPIMSSPHSSGTPPLRTRDSPLVDEPVAGPSNTSSSSNRPANTGSSGKLPNRDYYPASYHQHQFDALTSHDPSALEERENLGLNSLEGDRDQQPQYSMPLIIECAILGSPHQRLTLAELRSTLKRRFRYYEKEEEKGVKSWERTLLQNLSKKERFKNAERPEPGQGGYWTINHSAQPPQRVRKRVTRRSIVSPQQSIPGTSSSSLAMGPSSSSGAFQWRPITARIHPRTDQILDISEAGPSSLYPSTSSGRELHGRQQSYHPYNPKPTITTNAPTTTAASSSSRTRNETTITTTSSMTTTSTSPSYLYPSSGPIYSPVYRNHPIDNSNNIYNSGLGSSTSLFRSIPTERAPDGRLLGRHSRCIILPPVNLRHRDEVYPSSPKYWRYFEVPPSNDE